MGQRAGARGCAHWSEWAAINSGSYHLDGLRRCTEAVVREFRDLGGDEQWLDLPPQIVMNQNGELIERPLGQAVRIVKRPDAARRVLLAIHVDTVYGPDDPFRAVTQPDANTLRGPGVIDAKGGLAVMLASLEAWSSARRRRTSAGRCSSTPTRRWARPARALFDSPGEGTRSGLLFEPAMPDGSLVAERKGSGISPLVVRGRSAHAGRNFHAGRNAVVALADFVMRLNRTQYAAWRRHHQRRKIEGGGAVNVVPDRGVVPLQCPRRRPPGTARHRSAKLAELARRVLHRDGYRFTLHGSFSARRRCPTA